MAHALRRAPVSAPPPPKPPPEQQLQKVAQQVVEEARMVLPGIQALFGFQLIAAFNARFTDLSQLDQRLHFVSMLLVALAAALIMTPAAYHRQVEPGGASAFFVRLASTLVTVAMAPLALGLCLDVYIIGQLIFASTAVAVVFALALLLVFTALWFVFPWLALRLRSPETHHG
jgi:hypothetical protein